MGVQFMLISKILKHTLSETEGVNLRNVKIINIKKLFLVGVCVIVGLSFHRCRFALLKFVCKVPELCSVSLQERHSVSFEAQN